MKTTLNIDDRLLAEARRSAARPLRMILVDTSVWVDHLRRESPG